MAETSFTYKISEEQGAELKDLLTRQGFDFKDLAYGHFQAKRGKCGVSYYHSGKVVIQGKESREFVQFGFEPMVLKEARLGYEKELNPQAYEPHFGVDESGKGDFFGPLVIAGCYVNEKLAERLIEIGVKDSKRIQSDKKAMELDEAIRKVVGPSGYSVVKIGVERYNQMHARMRNLNLMLAWGHGKVIELLMEKQPECPRAVSDQFAPKLVGKELVKKGLEIELESRTKAESDVAVAAASIIARAGFVRSLVEMGEELGVTLKKGASRQMAELAKEIAIDRGVEGLEKVAKRHFKTFNEVLQSAGFSES